MVLRPIWDFGEQFTDKDIALFTNPLYKKPTDQSTNARKSMLPVPVSAIPLPGLHNPNNPRFSLYVSNRIASPVHTPKSQVEVRQFFFSLLLSHSIK